MSKVLVDRELLAGLVSNDRETRLDAERRMYGVLANQPAPAQDERSDELEAIRQYAFEVGGTEGGSYILEPEELDEVVRRSTEPFEDVLRSLACFLGAGGYNAPVVDPAVFEQKIRWGIDQLTSAAQAEQQPPYPHEAMDVIATSRYQVVTSGSGPLSRYYVRAGDGKCELYRGGKSDCEHVARKLAGAFLDGGLTAFGLYAAPIAQTAPQPVAYADPQALANFEVARKNGHTSGPYCSEWMHAHQWRGEIPLFAAPQPAKRGDA